ncbi:hypothetical protein H5410_042270 [Solanum commersonii]|uniref:NB-ARC domain-containing protein n=1 Tax=Solanum commersonii TaxID=4109 RepID=A0A9J5XX51_SOLCO|nr:hypothetical protein H5410_042270 [Solanum commersonii]
MENPRSGCISNYKLSKRIAKLRKPMAQLLQDPGFISAISQQPQAIRLRSHVERPGDFLCFTSRKPTMDEIMNSLNDEGRSIVRVYGMGGDIAYGLGVRLISSGEQERADDLRNILNENDHGNILLILDDLWVTISLSTIGIPQYSESCKCKTLITTRQMNVCDDLNRRSSQICVRKCIELSYDYLPTDLCKRLFFMCSFFPEDYSIPTETLTRYCMGLDLIPNMESVKEARRDIHQTVHVLKASCLLLDGDKEETVKMRHVIRDISIQIGINQQQPKSVAKAGMALDNWPGDILTRSCGAISLCQIIKSPPTITIKFVKCSNHRYVCYEYAIIQGEKVKT